MPYAKHQRITLSGTIAAADGVVFETFSFGVAMSAPGGVTDADSQGMDQASFDDIVADCVAFFGRGTTAIASGARLREVKQALIGPNGLYTREPNIAAVNVPGASSPAMYFPPQVSLAVSLVTARRGATGRGRFYLPVPGISLGADGLVSTAARDNVALSARQWLNDLNNAPGVDTQEPKVTVASSKGYNSDVIGVRVGRAFDTIRSRREGLIDAYGATLPVS